jgi:hypothetical protein
MKVKVNGIKGLQIGTDLESTENMTMQCRKVIHEKEVINMSNQFTGVTSVVSNEPTVEELKAQLEAANLAAKALKEKLFAARQNVAEPVITKAGRVAIKIKGQQYPLSLHRNQWEYIKNNIDLILAFCDKNEQAMKMASAAYKQTTDKEEEVA